MKWLFLFLTIVQWYLFCFLVECFDWWSLATAAIIAISGVATAVCTGVLFVPKSLFEKANINVENHS